MRRKVCVVVTARPSYSRIKTALDAMKAHSGSRAAARRRGLGAARSLWQRRQHHRGATASTIAARVYSVLEGENPAAMAKTTGLGLLELATVFDNLKPDVVVTVADRYETLSTAVAAAYMNIPVAHVQGGEVTGSIDEKVRHAVTKLADVHLVSTQQAAERVIRMGEEPDDVFVTGCPSIDLACRNPRRSGARLRSVRRSTAASAPVLDLSRRLPRRDAAPGDDRVSGRRARTCSRRLHVVHELGMPTLWFWPNVDAGSDGTSSGIRTFRERSGRATSTSSRTWRRPTSCGCSTTAAA